jgi:inositol transport system permease protein
VKGHPHTGLKHYREILFHVLQEYFMVFIVVAMIVLISIISPTFLTVNNMLNILKQISVVCLLAIGVGFLVMSGNNDLGNAAGAVFSSVVMAETALRLGNTTPLFAAFLIAVGIGILVGLLNGSIIAFTGINAFISTLGVAQALQGASLLFSKGQIVSNLKPEFLWFSTGKILGISPSIWILILVAVIMHVVLTNTRFGKYVKAIGGNATAARISGIKIKKIIICAFIVEGAICGIAGFVLAARMGAANPQAGATLSLDALTGAIIGGASFRGGVGTIWGIFVGAVLLGVMNSGLNQIGVSAYWQLVAKGAIIVLAVILDELKRKKN